MLSNDFRGKRSLLICFNLLKIRRKICRGSLNKFYMDKIKVSKSVRKRFIQLDILYTCVSSVIGTMKNISKHFRIYRFHSLFYLSQFLLTLVMTATASNRSFAFCPY